MPLVDKMDSPLPDSIAKPVGDGPALAKREYLPSSFPRKFFILAMLLLDASLLRAFTAGDAAPVSSKPLPPKHLEWSFEGRPGSYDRAALKRGFKVYQEACSSCHALSHVFFRDLGGGPGFSPAEISAIAAGYKVPAQGAQKDGGAQPMRTATPADSFPPPILNGQAMAMNGRLPPDLSLIANARAGGSDYIYSLITGFGRMPPASERIAPGMHYNPYFPGHQIAMPPPLTDNGITYTDGTKPTVDQQARDVVTFLAWAADPKMENRQTSAFSVILYLILFIGLLYLTFRHIWRPWH